MAENFPVPEYDGGGDLRELVHRCIDAIKLLFDGKNNALGTITLTADATTTTVTDARIGGTTRIFLSPTTENAAGEVILYPTYPANEGSIVLNHQSDSRTDRTFLYALIG